MKAEVEGGDAKIHSDVEYVLQVVPVSAWVVSLPTLEFGGVAQKVT